jgi:uncharacterized RDD family membrane protein YckC
MSEAATDSLPAEPAPLPTPTIRRRLASLLYEALLLLGVLSVAFMLPHLALGLAFHVTAPGPMLLAHVYAVLGVYFIWFWCKRGQTLAMQTWRIRLLAAQNQASITVPRALLRYSLAWFSLLFYGAGLVWAVFDRDQQFLHDRLAGTRLVLLPPSVERER